MVDQLKIPLVTNPSPEGRPCTFKRISRSQVRGHHIALWLLLFYFLPMTPLLDERRTFQGVLPWMSIGFDDYQS